MISAWVRLAGALTLATGLWIHGNTTGKDTVLRDVERERTKSNRSLYAADRVIGEQALKLEEYRHAQSILAQELEEAARADPDNRRRGIGADGMQRLEPRWRRYD